MSPSEAAYFCAAGREPEQYVVGEQCLMFAGDGSLSWVDVGVAGSAGYQFSDFNGDHYYRSGDAAFVE